MKLGTASVVIGYKGKAEESSGWSQSNWRKGENKYVREVAYKYSHTGEYDRITIKYGETYITNNHIIQFRLIKEEQIWP